MTDSDHSDRNRVVKSTLLAQGEQDVIVDGTPADRMGMVWQLTLDAWAFLDPVSAKSEFQRHVVRVKRGGR